MCLLYENENNMFLQCPPTWPFNDPFQTFSTALNFSLNWTYFKLDVSNLEYSF